MPPAYVRGRDYFLSLNPLAESAAPDQVSSIGATPFCRRAPWQDESRAGELSPKCDPRPQIFLVQGDPQVCRPLFRAADAFASAWIRSFAEPANKSSPRPERALPFSARLRRRSARRPESSGAARMEADPVLLCRAFFFFFGAAFPE